MDMAGLTGPRVKQQGKRIGGWLVVVILILITFALVYYGSPFHAIDGSVEPVESDDRIRVEQTSEGYLLEPANAESTTGLVFYPGGKVHPDAYVASLAPIVREENVTVVIPEMPLNLAIFDLVLSRARLDPDEATVAIDRHPDIETWYVGGHSLGGAMACRYARNNPGTVDGLILYAAYCDKDISESGLAVLSVTGSDDAVLNREKYQQNQKLLPEDATLREIEGMNHSQFGSYTGQPGGQPAAISFGAAHEQLNEIVINWLENKTGEPSQRSIAAYTCSSRKSTTCV